MGSVPGRVVPGGSSSARRAGKGRTPLLAPFAPFTDIDFLKNARFSSEETQKRKRRHRNSPVVNSGTEKRNRERRWARNNRHGMSGGPVTKPPRVPPRSRRRHKRRAPGMLCIPRGRRSLCPGSSGSLPVSDLCTTMQSSSHPGWFSRLCRLLSPPDSPFQGAGAEPEALPASHRGPPLPSLLPKLPWKPLWDVRSPPSHRQRLLRGSSRWETCAGMEIRLSQPARALRPSAAILPLKVP